MAEVVGTAFVRIQAITTGLAKEIERGIKKGTADARVDDAGEELGREFADNAGVTVRRRMQRVFDNLGDRLSPSARRAGRRTGAHFGDGMGDGVDRDRNAFSRILRRVFDRSERDSERGGFLSGRRFGRGFGGGMRGALRSPAILLAGAFMALPALGGLVNLVGQYVVALVGHLGMLVTAATAAGLALGGVLGAALLGLGPLMAAFLVDTPQLEAFKNAAKGIGEEWKVVATATQRQLLPSLLRSMRTSRALIPIFRDFGSEVGRVAGEFAEVAAATLTSEEAQGRWRRILEGSTPILQILGRAALNLGDVLSRLFEAVLPFAQDFATRIENMTARWAELINLAGLPGGGLEPTLRRWYENAILVWDAISQLSAVLWNLLDIGSQESVPFFENFRDWAREFRDFTNSEAGQNRLGQIFSQAMEVAREFNGLVADIFRAIGSDIFAEGGADGLIGSLQTLRTDVVPWLDSTFREVIDTLGPSMKDFAGSLGQMFQAMQETGSLTVAIQVLDSLVQSWTRLLELPGIGTLLGALMGLGTAFAFLKTLGITKLLPVLTGGITTLAGAIGGVLLGATAPAWAAMAAGLAVLAAIAGAVMLVITHWDTLVGAFQAVVRFIRDPMDRLERLGEILGDLAGTVRDFVGGAFSRLPELFGNLRDVLGDLAGSVAGAIADFGSDVAGFLLDSGSDIRDGLAGAFSTAVTAVREFPGRAVDALARFGPTVIDALITGVKALPGLLREVFVRAMQFAINAIFTVLLSAPYLLVMAIVKWGPPIVNALSGIFGGIFRFLTETVPRALSGIFDTAFRFLTSTLPSIIAGVLDFFVSLPGRLIDAAGQLGSLLLDLYSAAFELVFTFLTETALPGILDFFTNLPSNIYNAAIALGGILSDLFSTSMELGKQAVSTGIQEIIDFFINLPGNIRDAIVDIAGAALDVGAAIVSGIADGLSAAPDIAGDIASAAKDAFVDMINSVIDLLNDGIPDRLGWGPASINIPDNPIPRLRLARGGIFSSATPAIIGEAGAEVVIPLTRPDRAAELAQMSGLYDVLSRARGGVAAAGAPAGRAGNNVNVQVYAQGTPAGAIVAEMEAKIDWALTTRSDR